MAASWKHKDNVLRVSEQARQRGKSQYVGVYYDVLMRQKMAELSMRNAPGFRVTDFADTIDKDVLERAELKLQAEAHRAQAEKSHGQHAQSDRWQGQRRQWSGHGQRGWNRQHYDRRSWGDVDKQQQAQSEPKPADKPAAEKRAIEDDDQGSSKKKQKR